MFKTYRFSLIYAILLGVIHYFHLQVEDFLIKLSGKNFALYIIYAVFLAFFLVIFFKTAAAKKNNNYAIILLTLGLIFFFIFTNPLFLFKLSVLELFFLGVLTVWEGKKAKSPLPFLILLGAAVLVEVASNFSVGSHFYLLDAWRNMLFCLSGYLSGSLLN